MNDSLKMCTSIVRPVAKVNATTTAPGDSKLTSALVVLDISRTSEVVSYVKRNNDEFMMMKDTVSVSPSSFSLSTALSRSEASKQRPPTPVAIRAMKNVFKVVEAEPSAVAAVASSKRLLPNIVSPTPSRKLRMITKTPEPRHISSSSSVSSSSFLSLCSSSMILQNKNQRPLKPKGQIFKMIPKKIKAMVKSSLPSVIHASKSLSSFDKLTLNLLDNKKPLKVVSNQKKNKVSRVTKKTKTDSPIKKSIKGGATLESSDKLTSIDNQDDIAVDPSLSTTDTISVQTIPSTTKSSSSPPKTKEHYQPVTVQHDYHDHANDPPLFLLYDYHHQHQHDDYYLKEETGTVQVEDNDSNALGDHVDNDDDKKCHHDDDHSSYSKFHQDLRQRSVTIKRSTSSQQPFPMKLYDVLEIIMTENKYTNVISWQPHGRCFVIHDHVLFKRIILPEYFNLNIMASFQRQLNLYGFKRITQSTSKDKNGYYHEYFLRGRYDLLYGIHRIKIKGTGIRAKSNPENEPKFWNNFAWITKRPYQQSTATTATTEDTTSSSIVPLKATSITTASLISLSTMDNHGTANVEGDESIKVIDDSNHHDHPIALEASMTTTEVITVQNDGDDDVSTTPMDLDEDRDHYIHHMTPNNTSFSQNFASSNTYCDNDRHDFVNYGCNNGDATRSTTRNDLTDQQLGNQSMDLSYGKSFLDHDIDDMIPLSISIFNDLRDEQDMETYLTTSSSHVFSKPLLPPISTTMKPSIALPNVVTPMSKTYYVSNDSMSDSDNMESNLELNDIINKRCYLQQLRCPSPMNEHNDHCHHNNTENNMDDDLYSTTSTDDYFIPCRPTTNHSSSNDVILLGWGKPFHYLNYFYEKMVPPNTTTSINSNNNTNCIMHNGASSSTNLISIHDIRDDFKSKFNF